MKSFFGDVTDKLRIRNEVAQASGEVYACTITSRKKHSSFHNFKLSLYKDIGNCAVDAILEYHDKAKTKLHAHGFVCLPYSTSLHKGDNRHTFGDFTFTLEKIQNLEGWKRYCLKHITHTLEWNNDLFNGVYDRFYKYGKRTLWAGD